MCLTTFPFLYYIIFKMICNFYFCFLLNCFFTDCYFTLIIRFFTAAAPYTKPVPTPSSSVVNTTLASSQRLQSPPYFAARIAVVLAAGIAASTTEIPITSVSIWNRRQPIHTSAGMGSGARRHSSS